MADFGAERVRDGVILVARCLLILVFIVFGWSKLTGYDAAVTYMAQTGAPVPSVAAIVAIVIEVFGALAVAIGVWTRPLALLLVVYSLATALIGHRFWSMDGVARYGNAINFYKNVSMMGGFLLLYITGPGRYSVDAVLGRPEPKPPR